MSKHRQPKNSAPKVIPKAPMESIAQVSQVKEEEMESQLKTLLAENSQLAHELVGLIETESLEEILNKINSQS